MAIFLIIVWSLFFGTTIFTIVMTEKQNREFNEALKELNKAFDKRRGY